MMLLKAGVSSTAAANAFRPTSDARSYYILGSRAENENLTLDGVSMLNGRNNLKGVELVSVDAVAEANILTSTYPAEFPRAGGGQVQGNGSSRNDIELFQLEAPPRLGHNSVPSTDGSVESRSNASQLERILVY